MDKCPKQGECKCYDGPDDKHPCTAETFEKSRGKCFVPMKGKK